MAATERNDEASAGVRQPEKGEDASDADTDELLNSADILCSGTSEKQQYNRITPSKSINDNSNSAATTKTPNALHSSVRRQLRFDVEKTASERKRQLNSPRNRENGKSIHLLGNLDRSLSCPATPKTNAPDNRDNEARTKSSPTVTREEQEATTSEESIAGDLRSAVCASINQHNGCKSITPFSIPLDSYAVLRFSTKRTDDEPDDGPISEKNVESLRSLLRNAKIELIDASHLIDRGIAAPVAIPVPGSSISSTSLSLEERNFLERLSSNELRDVYEAEVYKRRYCEKKIDILQKQLLDFEQKLSVAMVAMDRYKNVISNVEQSCDDFVTDVSAKEQERKRDSAILHRNNDQLKVALERLVVYGKSLTEKINAANDRIVSLETDLESVSTTSSVLERENTELKQESRCYQLEVENLRKKLDQCESKRKASYDREEQLMKDLLTMEKTAKENETLVQKLKNELNNERSARRSQTEEKERIYKERLAELAKDFDSRVEKTRQEIELRTTSEMRKLKEEWDLGLCALGEKYSRVVNERDEALRRLKEYEETFSDRQRLMCYELQQRLSAKYYELLSEFSPPGFASVHDGNGNSAEPPPPPDFPAGCKVQSSAANVGQYQNQQGRGQIVDPAWLSSSLADEFLDRLRNVHPIGNTPRHSSNDGKTEQDQIKRVGSKPSRGHRGYQPGDGQPTNK